MNTFLVTSHGRSGTKWLARELNRSKQWTVEHEHNKTPVGRRFFGNVDSRKRHEAAALKYGQLAVIVRPPLAIARSAFFRRPATWTKFLATLRSDLMALDMLLGMPGTLRIEFEKMVSSRDYLQATAMRLGVEDIELDEFDLAATNSSPGGKLSYEQVMKVNEHSAWFDRKWC